MKRINLKLSPDDHRRLRILAAESGQTMSNLIAEWIHTAWQSRPAEPDKEGKR